jgi:hippurate hydrolase
VFVKIVGSGGHAARPHLAADPLVAAAAIVKSLQTVVARNVDPAESAVVTVARLRAGDALNVIPGEADLGISVRSYSPQVRALLKQRIVALVTGIADAHGTRALVSAKIGVRHAHAACPSHIRHSVRHRPADCASRAGARER